MKLGRNLRDLAIELRRQLHAKQDLLAPSKLLVCETAQSGACALTLAVEGERRSYMVGEIALHQIAEKLKIPFGYFERMRREQPELLDRNVNTWLQVTGSENRLVRTLDGRVRAFLSDRYRRLDNYDFAEFVLPKTAGDSEDASVARPASAVALPASLREALMGTMRPGGREPALNESSVSHTKYLCLRRRRRRRGARASVAGWQYE